MLDIFFVFGRGMFPTWVDTSVVKTVKYGVLNTDVHCMKILCLLQRLVFGAQCLENTSRGECRLTVFENRVLRRIFGPKRDEVTGE
jgi:hypothetical protein